MSEGNIARTSMMYLLRDKANLVSLVGVVTGALALFAVKDGFLYMAVSLLFWAVFLDHLDGHLARHSGPGEIERRRFGSELDSLADLLNFGAVPALLIYATGPNSSLSIISALSIAVASALRLAYFNIYGVHGPYFVGLATTQGAFIIGLILLGTLLSGDPTNSPVLPAATIVLSVLEISPLRVPKIRYSIGFALLVTLILIATAMIWSRHWQ